MKRQRIRAILNRRRLAAGVAGLAVMAAPAMAAAQDQPTPAGPAAFGNYLATTPSLLGDMAGLRPWLAQYGATLSLTETSEILGNLTGGTRRGFEYDGLTTAIFQLDTQKAFGWWGGTFNISALQIHGRNLSADNLDNLQTASGIEADPGTRLWELWYQQQFWNGRADLKIGQQSIDQEFMVTSNGLYFLNAALGWPALPALDIPAGGPAYPLSAPGVRLRAHPTPNLTVLAGVFSGSPSPDNAIADPQLANSSGTSFPVDNGVLAIAELQYTTQAVGDMVMPGDRQALPGTYRLGAWYDSEKFADYRYDNTGLPLASPVSTGIPRIHGGDYGFYAVADQMVWQQADDSGHNLNLFARLMGTPDTDRNLVDFALNAGLTLHEPLPGRANDTFGVGMGYTHVSGRVAGYDRDDAAFNPGTFWPTQSGETFIEITYQAQVTPWLQLQPDFQYFFNPGGGIANPNQPNRKVEDEAILCVRANITF